MVDFGRISGSLRVGALLLGAACAGAGGGRPLPVRLDAADVRSLYLRRPLEAWRAYEGEYAEMLLMVTDVSPVTGLVYLDPVARSGGEGSLFWCRPETSAVLHRGQPVVARGYISWRPGDMQLALQRCDLALRVASDGSLARGAAGDEPQSASDPTRKGSESHAL